MRALGGVSGGSRGALGGLSGSSRGAGLSGVSRGGSREDLWGLLGGSRGGSRGAHQRSRREWKCSYFFDSGSIFEKTYDISLVLIIYGPNSTLR